MKCTDQLRLLSVKPLANGEVESGDEAFLQDNTGSIDQ